jgi:hypothetical protein
MDSHVVPDARQHAPGLLISQLPLSSGYLYTRRQLDLPSSRVTPVSACPVPGPRWCPEHIAIARPGLLPSELTEVVGFHSFLLQEHILMTTIIIISGLAHTACTLDPPGSVLPLLGLHAGFTTDLPATLWSGGTFPLFYRDHPLGNISKFHEFYLNSSASDLARHDCQRFYTLIQGLIFHLRREQRASRFRRI